MGQEISANRFSAQDFSRFTGRLELETDMLARWLRDGKSTQAYVAGFELEAWLLDRRHCPSPSNETFLARLASPLVVPELSRFNVELNCTPQRLHGAALSRLERRLTSTWQDCVKAAADEGSTLVLIGILPTVREQDLCLANISPLNRFFALNEQVLKSRGGRPLRLDIRGRERIALVHEDVMLEAAATSFQIHMQVPSKRLVRYYNASLILSAPLVAVSANSPFLFGADLWDETRIPLFEQAVDTGDEIHPELRRVTFGSGYLRESPAECFDDNLHRFPVLLPILFDANSDAFAHLKLHNGTIWRWNRLLLDTARPLEPQLRIEHRVMPAGPSIADMVANAALYYGATRFLAGLDERPEAKVGFESCRENFYQSACQGLSAQVSWLGGQRVAVRELVLEELLPMARQGLKLLEIDEEDSRRYLGIISDRVRSGQNGTAWQRAHAEKYGRDLVRLTADYLEHQRSRIPVHEWAV